MIWVYSQCWAYGFTCASPLDTPTDGTGVGGGETSVPRPHQPTSVGPAPAGSADIQRAGTDTRAGGLYGFGGHAEQRPSETGGSPLCVTFECGQKRALAWPLGGGHRWGMPLCATFERGQKRTRLFPPVHTCGGLTWSEKEPRLASPRKHTAGAPLEWEQQMSVDCTRTVKPRRGWVRWTAGLSDRRCRDRVELLGIEGG